MQVESFFVQYKIMSISVVRDLPAFSFEDTSNEPLDLE
jgi:hypothetical protein